MRLADSADFSEFYWNFAPILVVFLVWQGSGLVIAANITQETMSDAYRCWFEIGDRGRWVRTVASRKLARHIARITNDDPAEPLPQRHSVLVTSIDAKKWEQRHEVLIALGDLSPRQRQVVAWTLSGYVPAEIASELHISFSAVRATLSEARGVFTEYLSREQTGGDINSHQRRRLADLDHWLGHQYHMLLIDVVRALEIHAGLREILTLTHHGDPSRPLDAKTGPATPDPAIPDSTPPAAPITTSRFFTTGESTATRAENDSPEHATPDTILLKFLGTLASWDLGTRLALRAHPIFTMTRFLDRVRALTLSLDAANDLAHVLLGALDRTLRSIFDRALAHDLDLSGDLDHALTHDLDVARGLARDLDRNLDHSHHLARDLARDLAHSRDHPLLPPLKLDYALGQILDLLPADDHAHLSARSLARDLDRVRALAHDCDRAVSLAHDLDNTLQILIHLHQALSDVTGLNLRHTDLTGIPLEGLRWSAATRWPPQIEHQIRRNSTQLADELFEISPDGTTGLPLKT